MSERSLENIALFYLKRYASTVQQLKRVLARRVDRAARIHGSDPAQGRLWIDALAEKLVRGGLLNDDAYATMKAQSLRTSGRGSRVIEQKLRLKGVPQALAKEKVREVSENISEAEAARIWAKKKRVGPFRRDLETRKENRMRDLAVLARAGFSYGIAKGVIDE